MSEHDTLMWEVRAEQGRLPELLDWIRGTGLPALRDTAGWRGADVYTASDDRAVIIARFEQAGPTLPEVPAELVRRPAHQWRFTHVLTVSP